MVSEDTRANMMFEAHRKSVFVAYLLWFFVGMFSIHRFYLRHWLSGLAQMALGILGPFSMIGGTGLILGPILGETPFDSVAGGIGIGAIALGLWFIWIFVDAILIPRLVRKCNETIVHQLTGQPTGNGSDFSTTNTSAQRTGGKLTMATAVAMAFIVGGIFIIAFIDRDQPSGGSGMTENAGSTTRPPAQAEPTDGEYFEADSPEIDEPVEPETEVPATTDDGASQPAPEASERTTEKVQTVDFNIEPILQARQQAVESGKAIRWNAQSSSGYAVPSSVTYVQGQPCRAVYVTSVANGSTTTSPSKNLCRKSDGGWR